METISWGQIFNSFDDSQARMLVLIPGSPPLIRLKEGLRALKAPTVQASNIESLLAQLDKTKFVYADQKSYFEVDLQNRERTQRFRVIAFGSLEETWINVTRSKGKLEHENQ